MKVSVNSGGKRSATPVIPKNTNQRTPRRITPLTAKIGKRSPSEICTPSYKLAKHEEGTNDDNPAKSLKSLKNTKESINRGSLKTFNLDRTDKSLPGIIPNGPIAPAFAKQRFRNIISTYENSEINDYKEIYFLGNVTKVASARGNQNNYGYDLPTKQYRALVGDHLAYRYEIVAILGRGAFGEVMRCYDHKSNCMVAVKILVNTPLMHKQGLIEIENQKKVMDSNYVAKVTDSFVFRSHLCMVTEVLGISLFNYLKSHNFSPLPVKMTKTIAFELISGLVTVHSKGIIHADLKPENILFLIGSTNHIKIIDFGSSCVIGQELYNYLQSRYYRAPEVILGIKYGTPIDMWSAGCIIAELAIGKPIFNGESAIDMLNKFVETVGLPPQNVIEACPVKTKFFKNGNTVSQPTPLKNRLSNVIKTNDQPLIDFLSKCFEWDQNKRMTAAKALKHPWLAKIPKGK
ncbi:Dual specificity tyrosine-phosphorylation-regulated kinase 2 [Tritrichomonas foetus]|uniref:dual-specificity kinase n=1 Tax=Tritrichomonas foetus TaxID=1144522 RepID=A0A1J4JEC9_9EUKA|nr:Dual specificity tyrosine-phosphorylation-regulated kinase 2 [Tritrichomonas foetus]|eukprot:OHS97514.1 Dual specificity tyrosine-phosphorylation-regulated kinase 2 [Tritrichomonas foetus]